MWVLSNQVAVFILCLAKLIISAACTSRRCLEENQTKKKIMISAAPPLRRCLVLGKVGKSLKPARKWLKLSFLFSRGNRIQNMYCARKNHNPQYRRALWLGCTILRMSQRNFLNYRNNLIGQEDHTTSKLEDVSKEQEEDKQDCKELLEVSHLSIRRLKTFYSTSIFDGIFMTLKSGYIFAIQKRSHAPGLSELQ